MNATPDDADVPRPVVVGLGEILWDVFPSGPRFGGAPANFACSAAGLGKNQLKVYVASGVGRDPLGEAALNALQEKSVAVTCVQQGERPTGQVQVELDEKGHATYEFAADAAWDHLRWTADWASLAGLTDIVCFGTLGQRDSVSRQTIRRFVAATPSRALRIFDINLRPPFFSDEVILESLELANVLKLNDDELPQLARLCGLSGSPVELLRAIAERYQLRAAALTQGGDGALLIRGDEISQQPVETTTVVDTVGAGDAFTAALALGLFQQRDLAEVNALGCKVAAFVCSQAGATPVFPAALAAFHRA
ncbi:PfkB family carbohydrate kinase [Lignipirellula cremea]|uniref:Fructosamine kinase FrlD n=1 Tax=Lignipirellula cremea TaxID=2528010 RepID=A0A518DP35_9BACT|nr:PfkB family carbohydrate kinase [Lignipirellula cremea]QDU93599.1 Fructosamine kinase FrlD [Lignipirellula cremea]